MFSDGMQHVRTAYLFFHGVAIFRAMKIPWFSPEYEIFKDPWKLTHFFMTMKMPLIENEKLMVNLWCDY